MAIDADQRLKLEIIFEGARENPSALNDFETGFVSSNEERFNTYHDGMNVSPKQWAILDKIYDKVVGNK